VQYEQSANYKCKHRLKKMWKRVHVWKFFKSHGFFAINSSKSPVLFFQAEQTVYAPKADGIHTEPVGVKKTRRVNSVLLFTGVLYPIRPAVKGLGLKLLPALTRPIDSNFPAHVDGTFCVHGAILMDFAKQLFGQISPVTNFISNLEAWRGPTRFSLARLGSSEMYLSVPV
jgi:hypothetical protein